MLAKNKCSLYDVRFNNAKEQKLKENEEAWMNKMWVTTYQVDGEKGEVTVLETSLCICYLYLEPREKILKEKFWH